MSLDDYITTEEAEQILEFNVQSVRCLVLGGRLQADKKARVWLIHNEAVLAYVKATGGKPKNDPTRGD